MDKVCLRRLYRGACACVKDTKGYYSREGEKESGLNDMLHHERQNGHFPLSLSRARVHAFLFDYFIWFDKYLHSIHCTLNKFWLEMI